MGLYKLFISSLNFVLGWQGMLVPKQEQGGIYYGTNTMCFQRFEKKYLLTPEQYRKLRPELGAYMKEDAYGRYTICSLYYDTPDFQFIRTSLEKPVYKEKLRVRSYGVPNDGDKIFVGLKKKFKGEVFKRRTVLEAEAAANCLNCGIRPNNEDQICHEIDWFLQSYQLRPSVYIAYDREALVGIDNEELRITFDTGPRWRDAELDLRAGDFGDPIRKDDRILMEIKIPGAAPVWLRHLLSENKVFPASFSKYGA